MPKPIYPKLGSQERAVLDALLEGRRITSLYAMAKMNIYALSQRCTRLRQKYGWPVRSEMTTTPTGKRVAVYFMDRAAVRL